MKNKFSNFFALSLLIIACCSVLISYSQSSTVTFTGDFSSVNIDDPSTVGIRGSKAPLSWDETTPLNNNGDGTYSVKLEFEEFHPGEEVSYKYVYGDIIWENDIGPLGNRAVYLYEGKTKLPVDTWNKLNRYSLTSLLEEARGDNFWHWIYIIGSEMKNGLSPEEIGIKYMAFWGSLDWLTDPETIMNWTKSYQVGYYNGYFEEVEKSPNKLVYKFKKTWINYFGQEEMIMNVSRSDVTRTFKALDKTRAMAKGWKCDWADEGDLIRVTLEY